MTETIDTTGCYANCIETFTGLMFDIVTPTSEVRIADIAHGLAHICRFGGQCRGHFSVAEHSINVHDILARKYGRGSYSFAGLMHDAEEAYLGDMVRPVKQHNPAFHEMGLRLQQHIRESLDVPWSDEIAAAVKEADNIAVRSEAHQLMATEGKNWGWGEVPLVPVQIVGYAPRAAEILFLNYYNTYLNTTEEERPCK